MNKITQDFINKAKLIHGDKYDYSKVDYKKSKEKVIIICSEHGEFEQTPKNHLENKSCLKCSVKIKSQNLKLSTQDFINKIKC